MNTVAKIENTLWADHFLSLYKLNQIDATPVEWDLNPAPSENLSFDDIFDFDEMSMPEYQAIEPARCGTQAGAMLLPNEELNWEIQLLSRADDSFIEYLTNFTKIYKKDSINATWLKHHLGVIETAEAM